MSVETTQAVLKLSASDAKEYLPESRPPRKIKLGIKEQHDYELNLFESASLSKEFFLSSLLDTPIFGRKN